MGAYDDAWREAIEQIRESADPLQSAHLPRLYALAERDGAACLRSFLRSLGAEQIRDLIFDLLVGKLSEILEAQTPRRFFTVALYRRAVSWKRRGDAAVVESPDEDRGAVSGAIAGSEQEARAFVADAYEALAQLSERDRDIVIAVGMDEDRDAIARAHHTSRANVDQIVSRVRKRFREAGP